MSENVFGNISMRKFSGRIHEHIRVCVLSACDWRTCNKQWWSYRSLFLDFDIHPFTIHWSLNFNGINSTLLSLRSPSGGSEGRSYYSSVSSNSPPIIPSLRITLSKFPFLWEYQWYYIPHQRPHVNLTTCVKPLPPRKIRSGGIRNLNISNNDTLTVHGNKNLRWRINVCIPYSRTAAQIQT